MQWFQPFGVWIVLGFCFFLMAGLSVTRAHQTSACTSRVNILWRPSERHFLIMQAFNIYFSIRGKFRRYVRFLALINFFQHVNLIKRPLNTQKRACSADACSQSSSIICHATTYPSLKNPPLLSNSSLACNNRRHLSLICSISQSPTLSRQSLYPQLEDFH